MTGFLVTLIVMGLYRIMIWAMGGRIVYSKTTPLQNIALGIIIGLAVISVLWHLFMWLAL